MRLALYIIISLSVLLAYLVFGEAALRIFVIAFGLLSVVLLVAGFAAWYEWLIFSILVLVSVFLQSMFLSAPVAIRAGSINVFSLFMLVVAAVAFNFYMVAYVIRDSSVRRKSKWWAAGALVLGMLVWVPYLLRGGAELHPCPACGTNKVQDVKCLNCADTGRPRSSIADWFPAGTAGVVLFLAAFSFGAYPAFARSARLFFGLSSEGTLVWMGVPAIVWPIAMLIPRVAGLVTTTCSRPKALPIFSFFLASGTLLLVSGVSHSIWAMPIGLTVGVSGAVALAGSTWLLLGSRKGFYLLLYWAGLLTGAISMLYLSPIYGSQALLLAEPALGTALLLAVSYAQWRSQGGRVAPASGVSLARWPYVAPIALWGLALLEAMWPFYRV